LDGGDTIWAGSTLSNRVRITRTWFDHAAGKVVAVPGNIQSIERAAAILRLLSGHRRLGVVDLAGELGLSKGTVHGLLRTLQHVGFVEQDAETGKYQLGAALLHMGSSYLDGNELRTRALNWSDSLAARTHEAVRIGTLHESQVLIVHHVFRPDNSLQTLDVGSLLPAHATALGKVLLASHPYVAEALFKEGLAAFTDQTICDAERLERELARVRERGWAADIGELSLSQVSLAAPIKDRTGLTVGAMGIFGPPERLLTARQPRGEMLTYVREAARAVSRELGAIPW
jgi:DNA-binding IclR family transcriptional regulator